MSIGRIIPLSGTESGPDFAPSQLRQAWKELATNVAAGNLDAAEAAFTIVQQLNPTLNQQNQNPPRQSNQQSAMESLGSALQAKNLAAAQSALSSLSVASAGALFGEPVVVRTQIGLSANVEMLLNSLNQSAGDEERGDSNTAGVNVKA